MASDSLADPSAYTRRLSERQQGALYDLLIGYFLVNFLLLWYKIHYSSNSKLLIAHCVMRIMEQSRWTGKIHSIGMATSLAVNFDQFCMCAS